MASINSVTLLGNLTRDPELRTTGNGTEVCSLRFAVNDRRQEGEEWVDVPNYFDVAVFKGQAKVCAQYLSKGSKVCVQGRLSWREWEDKEGNKRQSVEVIANSVDPFLNGKGSGGQSSAPSESADVPEGEVDPELGF